MKSYCIQIENEQEKLYVSEKGGWTSNIDRAMIFQTKSAASSIRNKEWYKLPRDQRKFFRITIQPFSPNSTQTPPNQ